jgi:hypothetical protein
VGLDLWRVTFANGELYDKEMHAGILKMNTAERLILMLFCDIDSLEDQVTV